MKNHAFTLIELLVVVLIIGILAAIALPQYRKAVVKARVATILPLLQSVRQAQEVYYMSNDNYTMDMADLDIAWPGNCALASGKKGSGPCGTDFNFSIDGDFSVQNYGAAVYYCPGYNGTWGSCSPKRDFTIVQRYTHAKQAAGERFCFVNNSSALGEEICKSLSGKSEPDLDAGEGYSTNVYSF